MKKYIILVLLLPILQVEFVNAETPESIVERFYPEELLEFQLEERPNSEPYRIMKHEVVDLDAQPADGYD